MCTTHRRTKVTNCSLVAGGRLSVVDVSSLCPREYGNGPAAHSPSSVGNKIIRVCKGEAISRFRSAIVRHEDRGCVVLSIYSSEMLQNFSPIAVFLDAYISLTLEKG